MAPFCGPILDRSGGCSAIQNIVAFISDRETEMESKGGVAAVDRAISIVRAFTHQQPVMTLAELARATGLYKSTILRLLGSLEKVYFIVQRADGSYQLGPGLLELSSIYQDSFDLRQFVQPALERLVSETGEGATFFVLEGGQQLCLFRVDGRQSIRDYSIRLGDRRPLDQGAAAETFRRFGRAEGPFRADTLVSTSFGSVNPEMAALAAPVFGRENRLAGVITLSGPISRLTPQHAAQIIPVLVREAEQLSTLLGARPGLIRYG